MNLLSKQFTFILLSTIIVCFIYFSMKNSESIRQIVKIEPLNYSYSFDGMSFLKTFYRMKQGISFYDANMYGISHDGRQGPPPIFVSGWRLPVAFWLWNSAARNGEDIWFLFLILSILSLYAMFDIAAMVVGRLGVLISSIFLTSYFYFALTSYQFLLIEWWGLFSFIIGLRFFMHKKTVMGVFIMMIGVFVRELFLIPFGAIIIASMLNNKKTVYLFLALMAIFIAYYTMHFQLAANSLQSNYGIDLQVLGQKFGAGGIIFLRQTLAYGTNFFITTQFRIQATLFMLMSTFAGGIISSLKRDATTKQTPFIAVMATVIAFLFIGTKDNDYWGITYVPLLPVLFLKTIVDLYQFATRKIQ